MKRDTQIEQRIIDEAKYIIDNRATVRDTAKVMMVSKSTVFNDMNYKLKKIDFNLFYLVSEILKFNKSVRHLRGGASTRKLYKQLREAK